MPKGKRQATSIWALTAVAAMLLNTFLATYCAAESTKAPTLTVLNYVTGWLNDANGYHPAVFMMLENTSSQDLTNRLLRFQARFTDLQTAAVSIGRKEIRRELKPHQQFNVTLTGTDGYELPFEVNLWPNIETKVLSRIGNAGEEGTDTLLVTKIESTTHTEDAAYQSLNHATSYAPNHRRVALQQVNETKKAEPPMIATAGKFAQPAHSSPPPKAAASKPKTSTSKSDASEALDLLSYKLIPGLGADFYTFEQRFGLPADVEAKLKDWSLAKYKHRSSGTEIVAGAKNHKSKVDLIVVKLPRSAGVDATAVANAGCLLAEKPQRFGSPAKSVRYLPAGRLEMVRLSGPCKIICMSPPADEVDNCLILVVSHSSVDIEQLLTELSQKSQVLKYMRFLEEKHDN